MDNDCFEPAGYSSLPVGGAGGGAGGGGSAAPSGQATVGGLKLHLPLDEDDYLMPSNGQQAGYMDLGGNQKGEMLDELDQDVCVLVLCSWFGCLFNMMPAMLRCFSLRILLVYRYEFNTYFSLIYLVTCILLFVCFN